MSKLEKAFKNLREFYPEGSVFLVLERNQADSIARQSQSNLLKQIREEIEGLPSYFLRVNKDGTSEMAEEPNSAYLHIHQVLDILTKLEVKK